MSSSCDESTVEDRFSDVSDSYSTSCTTVSTLDHSTSATTLDSEASSQNIRVVARIRPLSAKERKEQSKQILVPDVPTNSIQVDENRRFEFDKVFQASATQGEVYEQTAGDMIQNHLFKGFNVTVLAYGQTGSGKTHTIFGANGNNFTSELNEEQDGVIPRAVHELFQVVKSIPCGEDRVKIDMSFLEIYNEEAKDLLSNECNPADLSIRETADGVVVKNLSRHSVVSPKEVAALMISAAEKRSTASTLMNEVSSRSHAICTLYITLSPLKADKGCEEGISAKLTLVDLAGSERIKKTGAEGIRLKEGININKGLFVLGQVVSALSELGQQVNSSDSCSIHVNYRDSKLTRLLQDSLGGNSKTVMVACVSPADSNTDESINTLRYAERTRSIKNSVLRNVVATSLSPAEAAALRKENQMLKLKLLQAQTELTSASSRLNTTGTTQEMRKLMASKIGNSSALSKCVRDEINGMGIRDLDVVTKLMFQCTATEEKLHQLEKKLETTSKDSLNASLKADEWKLKYEKLMTIIKENGIPEAETEMKEDHLQSLSDITDLRKEIKELKDKLDEAGIDAEVSRATAAAVLNGKGDLKLVAETMALFSNTENEENIQPMESTLSAELDAMSGTIEEKEIMIRSVNQEREGLESMKFHFEGALKALQEEVGVLSSEKDELLSRIQNESSPKKDIKVRGLKRRIQTLEKRMKELKQKASEHAKALRLREQAEKKVLQLEAELREDKKKRAALQRKLKDESIERRNERKEATVNAAKCLRDSNRIKRELTKVKESAARQENVLRRKAEQALKKNQRLEMNNRKRMHPSSSKTDISLARKEEINAWIEKETNDHSTAISKPSSFVDSSFWQSLCHSELRHVSQILFQRTMENLHKDSAKKIQKKKKKKQERAGEFALDPVVFLDVNGDDDEGLVEDSDDSDWSPDSPHPRRKKLRKSEEIPTIRVEHAEYSSSDEESAQFYKKMTVNKLRGLLRQSGLTVSGKKADLIKRLQYSARAKKALISPTATSVENTNIHSTTKKTPVVEFKKNSMTSTKKKLQKRSITEQDENILSSKKLKLSQETISSFLRKRSPIVSSSRSITSATSNCTLQKKPLTSLDSISSQKSRKKTSGPENSSKSSQSGSPSSSCSDSNKTANSSKTGSRSSKRRKNLRKSPRTISTNDSDSDVEAMKENCKKVPDHRNTRKPKFDALSTITNSARKRRSKRRAGMNKSVNKALLQLEQLEQIL